MMVISFSTFCIIFLQDENYLLGNVAIKVHFISEYIVRKKAAVIIVNITICFKFLFVLKFGKLEVMYTSEIIFMLPIFLSFYE
jgi:hypothetical protein